VEFDPPPEGDMARKQTSPQVADVLVERHGTALLARLNRPQHRNSIQGTIMRDLLQAAEEADSDDTVRAFVTIGEGPTYCVGADRDVLLGEGREGAAIDFARYSYQGQLGGDWGMAPLSVEQKRADTTGWTPWVRRFLDIGTPTIAALNGGAAGGGFSLALLHDIRIASRTMKLAPNFTLLGASTELGVSWLLPRIVGYSKAFDLLTRSRPIEADEALELGLVESVVDPHELLDAALARAAGFSHLSSVAVRMVKRLLRQAMDTTLDDHLEREWNAQVRLLGDPQVLEHLRHVIGQLSQRSERL
jgi:enoyl-CoA hydratase/carnithine racemase